MFSLPEGQQPSSSPDSSEGGNRGEDTRGGSSCPSWPSCHIIGGMDTQKIPTRKLSRKKVAEALKSVPVEVVLLGAAGAKSTKLTAKQKAFAEGVALGKTGAQAYRDAYDSQGKPATQGQEAARLKADPKITAQIEAITLANEAAKYATPAALRALVIQQLTAHAISDEVKPAQRLKALELLGKVTEVAAFTERREIIKTTDATTARAMLLENLRQAIRATATDANIIEASPARVTGVTLPQADELGSGQDPAQADPGRVSEAAQADPTAPPPPEAPAASAPTMLSNPHTGSHSKSDPQNSVATQTCQGATDAVTLVETLATVTPVTLPGVNPNDEDTRVTPVTLLSENPDDSQVGGGGEKNPWDEMIEDMETPPAGNWK